MKSPSLWSTIKQELLSITSFVYILIFALSYFLLSVVLLNYKLLSTTLGSSFQLSAKIAILFSLVIGTPTSLTQLDFSLLIINALFFGINILLIGKTISVLEHQGKVRLSIGGATLISLVTTGCASCGLSLLSILGVTASLSFLPFFSLIFHIGATIILVVSTMYMLIKLHNGKYCKI